MYQESGMHQSLLAAKGWLAKKGLTMPRLELISAHMAANIIDNVRRALEELCSVVCVWMDRQYSSFALDRCSESFKQFLSNIVAHINAKAYVKWRYSGTEQRHTV